MWLIFVTNLWVVVDYRFALVKKIFISQPLCVFSLNMKQKPTLKFQNADVNGNNRPLYNTWNSTVLITKRYYLGRVGVSSDLKQVCYRERLRYGALAKKNSTQSLKLSVRVEVSSVESNETTAATVSCDLAPPPQRRRRRHPPPPRNHVTFLSLHSRDQRKPTFRYIIAHCYRNRSASNFRRQLPTWHCSHLLLNAMCCAPSWCGISLEPFKIK